MNLEGQCSVLSALRGWGVQGAAGARGRGARTGEGQGASLHKRRCLSWDPDSVSPVGASFFTPSQL